MKFKELEVSGFKSFAEKTNFYIEKGLTGIVGPNGCGKSNVVEALRWCMGETSAKSLRGLGMEDVIFNGTSDLPSKNICEVSIKLENDENIIQYKNTPEIEIKRKLEKDKGSKYYINGKEVRAKDVQILFADLSTGPHSPSMVSQGRVGALITAKPTDRRAILEEAAGIAGLHARRHEAELRLNAAENNLKKADDVTRQTENQLKSLLKQAEEASKYKEISDEIRRYEAAIIFLNASHVEEEINESSEKLNEHEDEIGWGMITHFPEFTSPFWNMSRYSDELTSKKIDVILNGMETIGSAERSTDKEQMAHTFHTISEITILTIPII